MPDCIKPTAKRLKRGSVKTCETGLLDYFWLALTDDLTTFPSQTVLTNILTYSAYATATGTFGTTAVWSKIEVKKNTLKYLTKNMGDLKNTSAEETTMDFELDEGKDTLGFVKMYKRAEVQIVIPFINGEMLWLGRKESPAEMAEFNGEGSIEKSSRTISFKANPYSPLYLPDNTVITPIVEV